MRTSMRLGAPLDASWYAENATSFLNWADTQDAQKERMMSRFLRPAEAHPECAGRPGLRDRVPALGPEGQQPPRLELRRRKLQALGVPTS